MEEVEEKRRDKKKKREKRKRKEVTNLLYAQTKIHFIKHISPTEQIYNGNNKQHQRQNLAHILAPFA